MNTKNAYARILAISNKEEPGREHIVSNALLLMEYLHRSALWAEALQIKNLWPFYSVAETMKLSVSTEIESEVKNYIQTFMGPLMRQTILWYMQWCEVEDYHQVIAYNLPAPYEPLIVMYERGGTITIENGIIDTDGFGMPYGKSKWEKYLDRQPLPSLDMSYLDKRDEEDLN